MTSPLRSGLWFVAPAPPFDLVFVDALMRRQLEARRRGCTVRLRNVPDELRGLLELLGLDGVLALEPRGEAELGEELRVDEVVQPADPAL
jgi:hypothetical protein